MRTAQSLKTQRLERERERREREGQSKHQMERDGAGAHTLHNSRVVCCESNTLLCDLHVYSRGKVDAPKKLVQRPRRRGHGPKDGLRIRSHRYCRCDRYPGGIISNAKSQKQSLNASFVVVVVVLLLPTTVQWRLPNRTSFRGKGFILDVDSDRAEHVYGSVSVVD